MYIADDDEMLGVKGKKRVEKSDGDM